MVNPSEKISDFSALNSLTYSIYLPISPLSDSDNSGDMKCLVPVILKVPGFFPFCMHPKSPNAYYYLSSKYRILLGLISK